MAKRNWVESPEISGLYRIINTDLPILHSRIGDIDFRKITLEQAEKLIESGTRYLEKVKVKGSKKEAPTD